MMKLLILFSFIVAANCLGDITLWNNFKEKFNKSYTNKNEEVKRFEIFQTKLRQIQKHNARYNKGEVSYKKGINKFSDFTKSEFKQFLGFSGSKQHPRHENITYMKFSPEALKDLPDTVDWREKNVVTHVKDQGGCGSCWAFSATGGLEGQYAIKYNKLIALSEQNLMDCSKPFGNHDCIEGGTMIKAFNYVKANGIDSEEVYPYDGTDLECRYQPEKNVLHISGYKQVPKNDEDALKYAVATYGPVTVGVNFDIDDYESGVFDNPECSSDYDDLDHGILVVGYGTEDGKDYWLCKNSWGTDFGERGYIKMARNANNQCGIVDEATWPLVI